MVPEGEGNFFSAFVGELYLCFSAKLPVSFPVEIFGRRDVSDSSANVNDVSFSSFEALGYGVVVDVGQSCCNRVVIEHSDSGIVFQEEFEIRFGCFKVRVRQSAFEESNFKDAVFLEKIEKLLARIVECDDPCVSVHIQRVCREHFTLRSSFVPGGYGAPSDDPDTDGSGMLSDCYILEENEIFDFMNRSINSGGCVKFAGVAGAGVRWNGSVDFVAKDGSRKNLAFVSDSRGVLWLRFLLLVDLRCSSSSFVVTRTCRVHSGVVV